MSSPTQYAPAPQPPVKKGLSGGKIALIVVGAVLAVFLVLGVGCAALVGSAVNSTVEDVNATSTDTEAAPADTEEEAAPADNSTLAQREALESAQSYVESGHFSKKGLTEQLTSEYGEDFSKADAAYAVKNVDVDYNAEAAEAAKSYLESGSFSRSSLLEQLTSEYGEQFTKAQAEYGVKSVGL